MGAVVVSPLQQFKEFPLKAVQWSQALTSYVCLKNIFTNSLLSLFLIT